MKKEKFLTSLTPLLLISLIFYSVPVGVCQIAVVDELISIQNESGTDQDFSDSDQTDTLAIPTDSGDIYLNTLNSEPLTAEFANNTAEAVVEPVAQESEIEVAMSEQQTIAQSVNFTLDMLTTQSVQEVTEAFLENGYSLDQIAEIFKEAGLSVEEIFSAMIDSSGGHQIKDVVGALLAGGYSGNEVFGVAIRYVKELNPGISDVDIVNQILGESYNADTLHNLMSEIFMDKISGVTTEQRAQIVQAMLSAGFTLDEIASAFINSGFSLNDVVKIFAAADGFDDLSLSVADVYDVLRVTLGLGFEEVFNALVGSGYDTSEVYSTVVNKLAGEGYAINEILVQIIGVLDVEEGATDIQLVQVKNLSKALYEYGFDLEPISTELMNIGFTLSQTAEIFKDIADSLNTEESTVITIGQIWEALKDSSGSTGTEVVSVLITLGYDVADIYNSVIEQLDYNITEIFTQLIGSINPESGPTDKQMSLANVLVEMLVNVMDTDQPEVNKFTITQIVEAVAGAGFDLESSAGFLKEAGVSVAEAYTAFINNSQNVSAVVSGMIGQGYAAIDVFSSAVADLKNQGYGAEQIVSVILGPISDDNPLSGEASKLVAVLSLEGFVSEEVCTVFIEQGYSLQTVANGFNSAGISLEDVYSSMITAGQSLDAVVQGIAESLYGNAAGLTFIVSKLEDNGYGLDQILDLLVGVISSGTPTSAQINKAISLTQILSGSHALMDICISFMEEGFTLENVGGIFKRSGIGVEDAYTAMTDAGLTAADVITSLLAGNYNSRDVYTIAVTDLMAKGFTVQEIISVTIGEMSLDNIRSDQASLLVKIMTASGYALDGICAAMVDSGYGLDAVAKGFKQAGISVTDAYNGMVVSGQSITNIVSALINGAKYSAADVMAAAVSALKAEGNTAAQIVTLILGANSEDNNLASQVTLLVSTLCNEGYALDGICAAMVDNGYGLDAVAKGFKQAGISVTDAYNGMVVSGQDISSIVGGMIAGGYDVSLVFQNAVSNLLSQGLTAEQIVGTIIGAMSDENTLSGYAVELVKQMHSQGIGLTDISTGMLAQGYSYSTLAKGFFGAGVTLSDTYAALIEVGGVENIRDITLGLMNGSFDVNTIFAIVVTDLSHNYGYTATQLVNEILGSMDSEDSMTNEQAIVARLFAQALKVHFSTEQIAGAFLSNGFNLEDTAGVLREVGISISDAYNALIASTDNTIAEVAAALIDGGFDLASVYLNIVEILEADPEYTLADIITELVGIIDAETGITADQKEKAELVAVSLFSRDYSKQDACEAFLNSGMSLDIVVEVFRGLGESLSDVYTAVINANGGQNIKDVVTALVNGGYDSVDAMTIAYNQLRSEGKTNEEIIQILVGTVDPADDLQVDRGQALTQVIQNDLYVEQATNTAASFVDLLTAGFTFSEIIDILTAKGFSEADVLATFESEMGTIVQELAKAGLDERNIVYLMMKGSTDAFRKEYIQELTTQLVLNNFARYYVEIAYYFVISIDNLDYAHIRAGLNDERSRNYDLATTQEAMTVQQMLGEGYSLEDISAYFAQEGYQLEYVAKLLNKMEAFSLQDIYVALSNTQGAYQDGLSWSDNQVISILIKIGCGEDVVLGVAADYMKNYLGMSADDIVVQLSTARAKVDDVNLLANTLIAEFYKSITIPLPQAYITIISAGYTITWIKDILAEKGYTDLEIEDSIQNNFAAIFDGLLEADLALSVIVSKFDISNNPVEYTELLAEHMILNDFAEDLVRATLIAYDGDTGAITRGIQRGLDQII
ncbi:MAG: hypothetical protein ABII88_00060 [Candidatus Omnitrophota bacterium]